MVFRYDPRYDPAAQQRVGRYVPLAPVPIPETLPPKVDDSYGASNPTFATVGAATGQMRRAFALRKSILFVNTSPNFIYLAKGRDAVIGSGIPLFPNGGFYGEPDNRGRVWLGPWDAIASVAGSNLAITEDW